MTEQSGEHTPTPRSEKLRKKGIHATHLVVAIAVLVSVWFAWEFDLLLTGGPLSKIEKETHARLKAYLNENARQIADSGGRILLTELLPFQWESACMVPPYFANKDSIEKVFGRTFPKLWEPAWSNDEQFWTLLVVVDKDNLLFIRVPRLEIGDFHMASSLWMKCVARDGSVLRVTAKQNEFYKISFEIVEQ